MHDKKTIALIEIKCDSASDRSPWSEWVVGSFEPSDETWSPDVQSAQISATAVIF